MEYFFIAMLVFLTFENFLLAFIYKESYVDKKEDEWENFEKEFVKKL